MKQFNKYKIRSTLFFIAFLIIAISYQCNAQEEKQGNISIGLGIGSQYLTEAGTDARIHMHSNLQVRKMFNTKVGIFAKGSLDAIQSEKGTHIDCQYKYIARSLSLGIATNTGRVLRFEEFAPKLTIINTFGFGRTFFVENQGNLNNQGTWNLSIGTELLYRIGKRTSISLSHSRLGFLNLDKTLDNVNDITTSGVDSYLDQFSIGFTGHLFKGNKKDHRDWYIPPTARDTIINNISNDYPEALYVDEIHGGAISTLISAVQEYNKPKETIFFRHDKYEIDQSARNGIMKIALYLNTNENVKATLKGWACIAGTDKHNQTLSENRAKAVFLTLINLGVNSNQLSWIGKGKDTRYVNEINHEFPKRVDVEFTETIE